MVGEGHGSFQLDADSLARLDRYQHRTAFTFASIRILETYQDGVINIAMVVLRPIGRCFNRDLPLTIV
jgi:hypothetical protein